MLVWLHNPFCLLTDPGPVANAAPTPGPRESPAPSLQLNLVLRSLALVLTRANRAAARRVASLVPRAIQSPDLSVAPAAAPRRSP